jgi:hypothetical protein
MSMDYLALCAIGRDEGRHLREWIEWHRMVGVSRFYFYDNDSSDDTRSVLEPYRRQRLVVYTHWPERPGQLSAYADCIGRARRQAMFIGFMDVDEFLVPASGRDVRPVLADFECENGLGVNWLRFGSSGHETPPRGLQIANYLQRSADTDPENRIYKSLVRTSRLVGPGAIPHYFDFADGKPVVDEDHEPIIDVRFTKRHKTRRIRINHYYMRSEQEFARKLARGRGATIDRYPSHLSDPDYARRLNEVRDERMLPYGRALESRVRLRAH